MNVLNITRRKQILDFANVETIYVKEVRTISLRIKQPLNDMEWNLKTISKPDDAHSLLKAIFSTLDDDQEHAVLLVLNARYEVVGFKVLASGAQSYVDLDAKIVYRNALLLGAVHIVLVHNHPSGNMAPSSQDYAITQQLCKAGQHIDIHVHDHLIYTNDGTLSMKEVVPEWFEKKK
jgi:DNA repair protein RadC